MALAEVAKFEEFAWDIELFCCLDHSLFVRVLMLLVLIVEFSLLGLILKKHLLYYFLILIEIGDFSL